MHFGVDAAVAFLVMFLVALLAGYPLLVVAIIAVVIGAIAAPFTRRAEERALAGREQPGGLGGQGAPETPAP